MAPLRTLLGSSHRNVKSHNRRAILLALLGHDDMSRAHLAELTGLSTTAITKLVAELIQEGIIVEGGREPRDGRSGAGRPRKALHLVPSARHAIGIHIGVGNVRIAITDLRARPVSYLSTYSPLDRSPEAVLEDIVSKIPCLLAEGRVEPGTVVGVGIGASGLVDLATGTNLLAPNLGWQNVPIRSLLAQHLDYPIVVDNNVRAMALGEAMFGLGQDARAMAFIYARIGVGAGFVVDGQLFRGSGAGAGEIGHTTVIVEGGRRCRCGNDGCLETLISEPIIVEMAHELAQQDPQGLIAAYLARGASMRPGETTQAPASPVLAAVFAAASAGDRAACDLVRERAWYLGIALANLVNVLNPELIVLGGILEQGQQLLLPQAEAIMRTRAFGRLGEQVRLQATRFGRQAGVVGAAALALDAFFYRNGDQTVVAPASASSVAQEEI